MSHKPSLRALARAHYRAHYEVAARDEAGVRDEAAQTEPDIAGGPQRETALTLRVRELYEGSVVPVRALARLAGVSERTLYKYVQKGGWRRRYPVRGVEAAAASRGRKHAPGRLRTAKGAGGRFVRSEDAAKPFARGLKALDPVGAVQADERCVRAGQAAEIALASARTKVARTRVDRAGEAQLRALTLACAALVELARLQAEWVSPSWRAVRLVAALEDAVLRLIATDFSAAASGRRGDMTNAS
jgi:hypothetical protein